MAPLIPRSAVRRFLVPGAVAVLAFAACGSDGNSDGDDEGIHSIKDQSPLATPVSKDLAKGDTYICGIHNYITGSIEVTS